MRLLVVAAVLALLVAPSFGAAAGEEPRLLVRIRNDGPELEVLIEIDDVETESRVFEESTVLPAGRTTTLEVALPPSVYYGQLTSMPAARGVFDIAGREFHVGQSVDITDCPGPAALDFYVTATGHGTGAKGCLVLSTRAAELLAEAETAEVGVLRPAFEIPMPGDADRGVVSGTLFEWGGDEPFLDAWGREVSGPVLRYLDNAGGMTRVGWDDVGPSAEAQVEETIEAFRYLPGAASPHAWTLTAPGFGSARTAGAASVTIERELRYDAPWRTLPCALRNELQGRTIRPGDEIAPDDICAGWGGPAWRATAPVEIEGYRLLPLYQVDRSEEGIVVGRVYLLEGTPYPLAIELHRLPTDGVLSTRALGLERYEPGGAPLERASAPSHPDPEPPLAPLDPLRGPALGDAAARVPFPLADASDAARADPTLRALQEVLARPDAALLAAEYDIARDEGAPWTLLRWKLLFGARDVPQAYVVCERSDSDLPVAPPARCSAGGDPLLGGEVDNAPRIGRAELPARAVSFADALARWDAVRAGPAGEPMTFASYRAWPDRSAPFLAVGSGVASPMLPTSDSGSGSADHVALDLSTARTLAQVEVVQATETIGDVPLATVGPSSLRARDAPFADASAIPLVVGAGIGLALLVLVGALLYSRLVRSRVLDDASRAAIHDIVSMEPGLHASGVLERLGKRSGVGEYHLDVLVREGFLTSVSTPGFRRYFVTGRHTPAQMRAIGAMREGQNEKLMSIIRAHPGIELRMLAQEAGVSVPYASRSIARLAEAGLVDKVQVGRALTLHAAES